MRIGINANYFLKPSTGIGVVTLEWMRTLAITPHQADHEWIWYYEGEVPAGDWPTNWQFRRVETFWQRDDTLHRFLWEHFSLPKAIKADDCEVFFSLYQAATVLPSAVRHAMFVHDLIPLRFPEYLPNFRQRFHYRQIETAIRRVPILIVPSEATRKDVESFLEVPTRRITVVNLGIDERFLQTLSPDDRQAVLDRYGLMSGYIYHGGGLERRKNTQVLLEAYKELLQGVQATPLPKLVISGTIHDEQNPMATPVRTLVRELGLENHVVLLGWVPDADLSALYQGAIFFVYPSRYEGFGIPVLEAFASGTPAITTVAGSLSELSGGAAQLVVPDSVENLAEAMRKMLTDSAERDRYAALGRERAKKFRWETFTAAILRTLLP
ncbi:MAG: glycosyltransferase family 4 protein [Undibacterium sp.]